MITVELVQSIHDAILLHTQGLKGNAKGKHLDAVLARVEHNIYYNSLTDHREIAAHYCIAINKGHVFNDGNKRTSAIVMEHYLAAHNLVITASDNEMADLVVSVASSEVSVDGLVEWLSENTIDVTP